VIITRTPVRISLFGGSSDYHDFIVKNGYGLVISAAIDQYVYISVKRLPDYFPYKTKVTYSEIECVQNNREIRHRAFRSALILMDLLDEPLEINYTADVPGRLGLGSSSALIVGLLRALHWYKHGCEISNDTLFEAAYTVEQQLMAATVGYQDYCPTIWGGLRMYTFRSASNRVYVSNQMDNRFGKAKLAIEKNGLLVYTKQDRDASTVAKHYIDNKYFIDQQEQQLNIMKEFLWEESSDPDFMGYLLNKAWINKRLIPGVSNEKLDYIYSNCYSMGAKGRLLGSGGGGTFFFLADPSKHEQIIAFCTRHGCVNIPFKIVESGSEKIYG
jgi:D-glycero-alpha-D-manno-heptose-7-phosphate kinase